MNLSAVDRNLSNLHEVEVHNQVASSLGMQTPVPAIAPAFVRNVVGEVIAGRGDALPVSAFPISLFEDNAEFGLGFRVSLDKTKTVRERTPEEISDASWRGSVESGADGLVLFNRFYQPDIDLDDLTVTPNLLLSTPMAMRLPLRWLAILFDRLQVSLAATSGIHTGFDVLKMLMAGADVTMLCSVLLRHGN